MKTIIERIEKMSRNRRFLVKEAEALTLILLASKSAEYNVSVALAGERAQADIYGIILGSGKDTISLHTIQDHLAPHTRSNLLVKSALSGGSFFKYEGFIKVAKAAQATDAYQRNENLLLSRDAKAESKPALEILANEVRCTHSATVGKIDKEQLYYLESRGINEHIAQRLIISGFFSTIIDKISDPEVTDAILADIGQLTN